MSVAPEVNTPQAIALNQLKLLTADFDGKAGYKEGSKLDEKAGNVFLKVVEGKVGVEQKCWKYWFTRTWQVYGKGSADQFKIEESLKKVLELIETASKGGVSEADQDVINAIKKRVVSVAERVQIKWAGKTSDRKTELDNALTKLRDLKITLKGAGASPVPIPITESKTSTRTSSSLKGRISESLQKKALGTPKTAVPSSPLTGRISASPPSPASVKSTPPQQDQIQTIKPEGETETPTLSKEVPVPTNTARTEEAGQLAEPSQQALTTLGPVIAGESQESIDVESGTRRAAGEEVETPEASTVVQSIVAPTPSEIVTSAPTTSLEVPQKPQPAATDVATSVSQILPGTPGILTHVEPAENLPEAVQRADGDKTGSLAGEELPTQDVQQEAQTLVSKDTLGAPETEKALPTPIPLATAAMPSTVKVHEEKGAAMLKEEKPTASTSSSLKAPSNMLGEEEAVKPGLPTQVEPSSELQEQLVSSAMTESEVMSLGQEYYAELSASKTASSARETALKAVADANGAVADATKAIQAIKNELATVQKEMKTLMPKQEQKPAGVIIKSTTEAMDSTQSQVDSTKQAIKDIETALEVAKDAFEELKKQKPAEVITKSTTKELTEAARKIKELEEASVKSTEQQQQAKIAKVEKKVKPIEDRLKQQKTKLEEAAGKLTKAKEAEQSAPTQEEVDRLTKSATDKKTNYEKEREVLSKAKQAASKTKQDAEDATAATVASQVEESTKAMKDKVNDAMRVLSPVTVNSSLSTQTKTKIEKLLEDAAKDREDLDIQVKALNVMRVLKLYDVVSDAVATIPEEFQTLKKELTALKTDLEVGVNAILRRNLKDSNPTNVVQEQEKELNEFFGNEKREKIRENISKVDTAALKEKIKGLPEKNNALKKLTEWLLPGNSIELSTFIANMSKEKLGSAAPEQESQEGQQLAEEQPRTTEVSSEKLVAEHVVVAKEHTTMTASTGIAVEKQAAISPTQEVPTLAQKPLEPRKEQLTPSGVLSGEQAAAKSTSIELPAKQVLTDKEAEDSSSADLAHIRRAAPVAARKKPATSQRKFDPTTPISIDAREKSMTSKAATTSEALGGEKTVKEKVMDKSDKQTTPETVESAVVGNKATTEVTTPTAIIPDSKLAASEAIPPAELTSLQTKSQTQEKNRLAKQPVVVASKVKNRQRKTAQNKQAVVPETGTKPKSALQPKSTIPGVQGDWAKGSPDVPKDTVKTTGTKTRPTPTPTPTPTPKVEEAAKSTTPAQQKVVGPKVPTKQEAAEVSSDKTQDLVLHAPELTTMQEDAKPAEGEKEATAVGKEVEEALTGTIGQKSELAIDASAVTPQDSELQVLYVNPSEMPLPLTESVPVDTGAEAQQWTLPSESGLAITRELSGGEDNLPELVGDDPFEVVANMPMDSVDHAKAKIIKARELLDELKNIKSNKYGEETLGTLKKFVHADVCKKLDDLSKIRKKKLDKSLETDILTNLKDARILLQEGDSVAARKELLELEVTGLLDKADAYIGGWSRFNPYKGTAVTALEVVKAKINKLKPKDFSNATESELRGFIKTVSDEIGQFFTQHSKDGISESSRAGDYKPINEYLKELESDLESIFHK